MPTAFTPLPPLPLDAVSESPGSGTFPPTVNTTVQDSNTSQGQKRKVDEVIAKPAKKARLKATEKEDMPSESVTGKELGKGTAKSDEANEQAGKLTLSGCVPLMPSHLAEAGYQREKKGVQARKVPPTKKPKSKGNAAKPVSKGAAKPVSKGAARKNVK